MQNQFNEAASRASASAITDVEALISKLSMRLVMLRNTISALTLAAYERPDDMARLNLPAILESLAVLLPDDDVFVEQLSPVAEKFMQVLMEAVDAERQRAVPPDLLVRIIDACSGLEVGSEELLRIRDDLHLAINNGYSEAFNAYCCALPRLGYEVETVFRGSEVKTSFKRHLAKTVQKAPIRKRERLTASA